MRYRIVIEIETDKPQMYVNNLAERLYNEAVTRDTNPLFCSTEKLNRDIDVLRRDRETR